MSKKEMRMWYFKNTIEPSEKRFERFWLGCCIKGYNELSMNDFEAVISGKTRVKEDF